MEDSQKPSKRTRPCDACRRRKSRCVTEGDGTICVLCKFHGQDCTWEQPPKPRKRNASRDDDIPNANSPVKRNKNIRTKPGTGIEEYDTLPGPSLLKRTLGLQNLSHTQSIGLNEIPDAYSSLFPNTENKIHSKEHEVVVRFVDPSHAFQIIPDASTEGYTREQTLIDDIEATVENHGPALVQLYFRIVHPSYPILHREVFLEKYARSYREFSPPLLAAVYLLACQYWNFRGETLADSRKPDSSKLRTLAFESFQSTIKRPKLSTIQAGLLLSQCGASDKYSWINGQQNKLASQLVDLAHTLGLHFNASRWNIPDWEISLRRRIGWAVYMQDKWTALLHGRPSLIHEEDWDVIPLGQYDFPEMIEDDTEGSSEVQKGRLVFMQMAILTEILSEVLSSLYSIRRQQELEDADDRIGLLLGWIKPCQLRLKDWFSSLPTELKMDTAASMKLSSVGYLRLAYLTIETCIHKHIIRTLSRSEVFDAALVQVCRSAAKERFVNSVDFVQRLQAQHLASFWYFVSAKSLALIFCFGQALASSAMDPAEKKLFDQKAKEFRFALRVNSEAGTGFMKQALGILDIPMRVLPLYSDLISPETSPAASTQFGSYTTSPSYVNNDLTIPNELSTTFENSASLGDDYFFFDNSLTLEEGAGFGTGLLTSDHNYDYGQHGEVIH